MRLTRTVSGALAEADGFEHAVTVAERLAVLAASRFLVCGHDPAGAGAMSGVLMMSATAFMPRTVPLFAWPGRTPAIPFPLSAGDVPCARL